MVAGSGHRISLWGTLLLVIVSVLAPPPVTAQDDRQASVSAVAIELSRIERSGNLLTLHDWMDPDARLVVSRMALATWYEGTDAVIPTDDPEILSVEFGTWTWPVTGRTYADVATVILRQPGVRQGVAVEQVELQHFRFDGARWRWFFGGDMAFIEGLNAMVTQDAMQGEFAEIDYARVDLVWSEIHALGGVDYRSPDEINEITTLPVQTGCGHLVDDDAPVFYCTFDQEIYYLVDFEQLMERQFGTYAWTHIIAHEWGHHIQFLHGIQSSENPELDDGLFDIELELQSDCLAGVYAQEAVARGWLSMTGLNDAYQVSIFVADLPDTQFDDPLAHGSAEQRQQAFTNGLEDGLYGCNISLAPDA